MITNKEKLIMVRALIDSALADVREGDSCQAVEKLEIAHEMAYGIDESKLAMTLTAVREGTG